MPSTGPNYASSISASATAPHDDNNWTSITNAGADDGVYASITSSLYDTNDWSYRALFTGFGFSLSAEKTISGITVEVEGYGANGASSLQYVSLVKSISPVGDDKGTTTSWGSSPSILTFGGPSDLWGLTWTPYDVSNSTFGVFIANKATADDADVYIDYVRITVTYTEGGSAVFQPRPPGAISNHFVY